MSSLKVLILFKLIRLLVLFLVFCPIFAFLISFCPISNFPFLADKIYHNGSCLDSSHSLERQTNTVLLEGVREKELKWFILSAPNTSEQ